MLQAMKEDLPINTKCKDKFLIQSTVITPEKESLPLQDIVRYILLCLRIAVDVAIAVERRWG